MKQIMLLALISTTIIAQPIVLRIRTKPQKEESSQAAAQAEEIDEDAVDGQVVLANVATMLGCIGMLSTAPHNPAVAGPNLAQIGVSFINIITQIFKSHGFDEELTRAHVETWFMQLSDETKLEILSLFIEYANQMRALQYCPNCECEMRD